VNEEQKESVGEDESIVDVASKVLEYTAPVKKHTQDYVAEYALRQEEGVVENHLQKFELQRTKN